MSIKLIHDYYVSIADYPSAQNNCGITEVTIGDLHANPIKFLYSLLRHGIIEFKSPNQEEDYQPENDYSQLSKIYENLIYAFDDIKK